MPEHPRVTTTDQQAEVAILRLVEARGHDKSICPSEAARLLAAAWQGQMALVRRAAVRLALAGRIDILRKGRAIDPKAIKGVIRLRLRATEQPG